MSKAAERTTPYSFFVESFDALMVTIMAPVGEPISPPTPRVKPEKPVASKPSTSGPSVIAQCGYATIVSTFAKDGKTPVFRASFADGMVDEMVTDGCAQFFQGCNVCSVQYKECSDAEKSACTDAACLEKTCERKVICSAKTCTAKGRAPTCESRLARTQCLKTMFE